MKRALTLLTLALIAACFDPPLEGRACDDDTDCVDGFVCADAICVRPDLPPPPDAGPPHDEAPCARPLAAGALRLCGRIPTFSGAVEGANLRVTPAAPSAPLTAPGIRLERR